MKKLPLLCFLLIFLVAPVFCCSDFLCLAADYSAINKCLNNALKRREAGDIKGAVSSIQKALSTVDTIKSFKEAPAAGADKEEKYTKKYLETLIKFLMADEITYTAVIRSNTSIIKKTRELFFKIADELKSGKISTGSVSLIKEMKRKVSRAMVIHSFCVPPKGYKEVYRVTQEALFRYSKAWGTLYLATSEKADKKDRLKAEALLNFQKGNELFSQAGTLMLAIPKK